MRRRLNDKGSILAWVLVSSVFLMVVCASLARLVLMRAMQTQRQGDSIIATKANQYAVAALVSLWSQTPHDSTHMFCDSANLASVNLTCTAGCVGGGNAGPCTLTGTTVAYPPNGVFIYVNANGRICVNSDVTQTIAAAQCP